MFVVTNNPAIDVHDVAGRALIQANGDLAIAPESPDRGRPPAQLGLIQASGADPIIGTKTFPFTRSHPMVQFPRFSFLPLPSRRVSAG
ncbi:hypothetical protein D7W81_18845 [Corallococcus aberystwythensis]|uniref:Uncharacterized protein n=1 Tax=Corallococcus aberystwythensis TaxID=2316722 RepID=A0A3A8QDD8_9BACT|nr:hypothetical protein D7W81_18845 [Corallococcus aberystwythensis]